MHSQNPWYSGKPPPGIGINRSHPLARGLVGAWLGNEMAGLTANNVAAVKSDSAVATLVGASALWGGGDRGGFRFTAGDSASSVDLGTSSSLSPINEMTAVVIYRSLSNTANQALMGRWLSGTDVTNCWVVYLGQDVANNKLTFSLRESSGTQRSLVPSDLSFQVNERCVVAAVADGATMRLYKNGIASATTQAYTAPFNNPARSTILGKLGSANYALNGTIEAAFLYTRGLSASEVKWISSEPYTMLMGQRVTRTLSVTDLRPRGAQVYSAPIPPAALQ